MTRRQFLALVVVAAFVAAQRGRIVEASGAQGLPACLPFGLAQLRRIYLPKIEGPHGRHLSN